MKKLFALLTLCCMSTLQADQLSDAIYESNVEKVQILLSVSKPRNIEIIECLDFSEKIVRLRKNNLTLRYVYPEDHSNNCQFYDSVASTSYIILLLSTTTTLIYASSDNDVLKIAPCFIALLAGTISISASMKSLNHDIKALATFYNDAIKIKDMLHNYSNLTINH